MGVAVVGAHADGVRLGAIRLKVGLVHDVGSAHPDGLADIELVGPVAGIGELVHGQTPGVHFIAQADRDGRVVREEVEEALSVVEGVVPDELLLGVGSLGIQPAMADVVCGDRAVVVEIRFVVGDEDGIGDVVQGGRAAAVLRKFLKIAGQQGKACRVVTVWSGPGELVGGIAGEDKTEVVGLNLLIGGTWPVEWTGVDPRQELVAGVVGGEGSGKLMGRCLGTDAGEVFVELGDALAADDVGDAGLR